MFEFISVVPPNDNDNYDPLVLDSDNEDDDPTDSLSNTSNIQARLITLDHETNILADPGWDGVSDISYLEDVIPKIDLIILSQTTVEYLGAFAYLLHKYPILKKVNTYATLPICKLGRLSTIELYRSAGLTGAVEGSIMEVEDIGTYFNSIIPLNYSQSISLQGKLAGITITAYNSGHTLGGSVWLFNKEAEKVVYAPVWNHSKDLFLKPCKLLNHSSLARPTTFLTGSDLGSSTSHQKRIDNFLQLVELTLYNGTSILIPTSLSGRFFELLPFLDQKVPREIPFYLVAYTGIKSLKSSSNMLEWMSPDVTKNWESQNRSPFDSTRIKLITMKDLTSRGSSGPKIVFVESLGFSEGSLARPTFIELCSKQNTALFLTERPSSGTMLFDIYKSWEETVSKDGNLKDGSLIIFEKELSVKVTKETALRGKDLNKYLKKIDDRREKKKQMELEEKKTNNLLDNMIDEDEDEDEEEDEEEEEDKDEEAEKEEKEDEEKVRREKLGLNNGENDEFKASATTLSAISKSRTKDEEIHVTAKDLLEMPMDFDIRNVKANKNKMFPFIVDRINVDDYGTVINHDDFKREEEKFFSVKRDFEEINEEESNDGTRKRRRLRPQIQEDVVTLYSMDSKKNPVLRTVKTRKVRVRCGLTFIDLSGLTDMRSWKFNTNGIKPRKVIVLPNNTYSGYLGDSRTIMESLIKQQRNKLGLHGTDNGENLNAFHSQSSNGVLGIDFIRGKLNEKINLGSVISSYSLQIDDEIGGELQWQVITGGYSLSHISGEVIRLKNGFKLVPSNKSIKTTNNKISIGDVKLNELRKRLKELNHIVEFKGDGTLVVDNQLAVRKVSDGNLMIDGGTGELFYKVRDQIQSMLAYV
ncbi:hypothetical protein FOA43_003174 [Brettanomyces nanus]|uniref:Cleavage and polyadenylation specificity factor subunit 2 n=1 Tax=Eeniella nana TaxID=13502 RepID=A0A875S789_EENNA|nr:uncharacterized protein FOA43_003174 [Brettanomyces nanus]QPG75812.1 hypothetical protein FOA43_003174 [Brettanomyces nanus]